MTDNTQLTPATGYDSKKMIFSEPQAGSIPNSIPEIKYKRIIIQTRNDDGTIGDLIIPTSELFSFGVSENTNMETGKVNGYSMPLCLHNRDGASKIETDWVDTFSNIVEQCKDHLVENRDSIEQYDLAKSDLKKFNPLYYKREKGKIVEGTGPTLYAKLIVSKKLNKIVTMYFDYDGQSVNPLELLGKYCNAKAAVKIESIFIGNKISLQVKLYECEVKLMQTGMKRLKRPTAQPRVLINSKNPLNELKEDENDSDGSVINSDDEQDVQKNKPVKKIVKRRVKKVIRKDVDVNK
jgi:hypothetical protein